MKMNEYNPKCGVIKTHYKLFEGMTMDRIPEYLNKLASEDWILVQLITEVRFIEPDKKVVSINGQPNTPTPVTVCFPLCRKAEIVMEGLT